MSIALTTHKVAAALVALAMVFSVAFVTPASAQTVEELTAQINSLLATIASLQSQLAGMTGGSTGTTTGGSSMCYTFTANHVMGDQGGEVMWIQKYLNANGFTVSATGAGSPGNETAYFGARTKAAVVAYQNANAASILAPVGLSAGTGYWGASSRAHANANTSYCQSTGTGTGTGTTVPTGTGITVSAAAQPGNSIAPASAARVPFTKFVVTNNSGVATTVNSVTIKRQGLSINTDFATVLLLDENGMQMGIERVLNSNDQATVGEAFTLQPGQSRTLTVAGNIASSPGNGNVASFAVVAINTTATVTGSLPIVGAQHTLNTSLSIGAATAARGVEDPNSSQTKEIGTTNYKFTSVKITAGSTENVRLMGIRFNQSGSASPSDLANVHAMIDGTSYPVTVSADGKYYQVNLGAGIVINEGLNKEVTIVGDIVSGTNRTVAFDVYRLTDIQVVGETYGYGITPAQGTGFQASTPRYDASTVTIAAGTFNAVSKSNSAPAANIAIQNADEILGAFLIDIKGEAVNVQTANFDVTVDAGSTSRSIDNVTLVDQNGLVLAGPVDSSVLTTSGGTNTDALTFTSVDFPSGQTTVFVKGQLDSNWVNNDTLAISTNPNSDWSSVIGQTTGDSITLPSATATANTMTVKAAALNAVTTSQPAARSVVAGAADFIWAILSLNANDSGEDMRVTAVVLEDTIATAGNATDIDNVEIWANLSGGSTADSPTRANGSMDRFETRLSDAEQFAGTGTGDHTLSITLDTQLDVAKNATVELAVIADLTSGATTGGTHSISLDTDAGDVTAVGKTSGTSASVTPTGAGQAMTPAANGALTITVDSTSPDGTLVRDDTVNPQTVGVFRFASTNVEDIEIDGITITDDGSNDAVKTYEFYVGSTMVGSVVGGATAEVNFADGAVIAPADGHVLVTVKAIMNNIDGTQVQNGDTVQATIAAAGDVEATGRDSGATITPTLTTGDPDAHTVYEAIPSAAFNNDGISTTLVNSTNHLLAKIVLTNNGDEDITLRNGDGDSISVQISVVGNGTATPSLTLKDQDGNVLDSDEVYDTDGGAQQIDFDLDGAFSAGITVSAGGSETISLFADTSDLPDDGDTIQVWLDDVAADFTFSIDGDGGNYTEGDDVFKGDLFGPAHVNPS